jgi:hypothetical protein
MLTRTILQGSQDFGQRRQSGKLDERDTRLLATIKTMTTMNIEKVIKTVTAVVKLLLEKGAELFAQLLPYILQSR